VVVQLLAIRRLECPFHYKLPITKLAEEYSTNAHFVKGINEGFRVVGFGRHLYIYPRGEAQAITPKSIAHLPRGNLTFSANGRCPFAKQML
jgi:hypothetical protein